MKPLELLPKRQARGIQEPRGLRAVIEDTMLEIMYDLPSRDDVTKCVITKM